MKSSYQSKYRQSSRNYFTCTLVKVVVYDSKEMWCVETLEYSRLHMTIGQSVELSCNSPLTANIAWTYDTQDGYVDYVYRNGRLDNDKPRLSVKEKTAGSHVLVITNAEQNDGGLYDCYDKGLRKVGYELFVAGMRSTVHCLSKT